MKNIFKFLFIFIFITGLFFGTQRIQAVETSNNTVKILFAISNESSVTKNQEFIIGIVYSNNNTETKYDLNVKIFNQNNKLIVNYSDKTNFNEGYLKKIKLKALDDALTLRTEIAVTENGKILTQYKKNLSTNQQQQTTKPKIKKNNSVSIIEITSAVILLLIIILSLIFLKKMRNKKLWIIILAIILIAIIIVFIFVYNAQKAEACTPGTTCVVNPAGVPYGSLLDCTTTDCSTDVCTWPRPAGSVSIESLQVSSTPIISCSSDHSDPGGNVTVSATIKATGTEVIFFCVNDDCNEFDVNDAKTPVEYSVNKTVQFTVPAPVCGSTSNSFNGSKPIEMRLGVLGSCIDFLDASSSSSQTYNASWELVCPTFSNLYCGNFQAQTLTATHVSIGSSSVSYCTFNPAAATTLSTATVLSGCPEGNFALTSAEDNSWFNGPTSMVWQCQTSDNPTASIDSHGNVNVACNTTGNNGTNSTNGVCGSAVGPSYFYAPTTNLCSAGTSSSMTITNPWTWICYGTNGGKNAICSTPRTTDLPGWTGNCGPAAHTYSASATSFGSSRLCDHGTPTPIMVSFPDQGSSSSWYCKGYGGLPNSGTCTASRLSSSTGNCGTANKVYPAGSTSFGSDKFCTSGTATPLYASSIIFPTSPTSPVQWTCFGSSTICTAAVDQSSDCKCTCKTTNL